MLDEILLKELQEYVENHLEIKLCEPSYAKHFCLDSNLDYSDEDLKAFVANNLQPTFSQLLFSHIDGKGVSDADIYKRAGIDRRHFSKIRSNPNYRLGKKTALALALALELNSEETDHLLSAAGYSLSASETLDLVIQFCLEKKIYDIHRVNLALDHLGLEPLTGS